MSISKFCTGEPEDVTLDLPGKGPVAKVHATLTFRPTEALNDSASDIERDAFGFEIVPLQRDSYRAHKDVLQRCGNDDRLRIEELLETGLFVNHQQVFSPVVPSGTTCGIVFKRYFDELCSLQTAHAISNRTGNVQ